MNKFFNSVCDVAVVVGTAVGVGLVSGKESQIFVGSALNVIIFAAVFCLVTVFFREFCRVNSVRSVSDFSYACFDRFSPAFDVALSLCAFVCIVTCLAGAEQCLDSLFHLSDFPLYSVAIAFASSLIMIKGMSALKIFNVISLVLTAVLFAVLFFTNSRTELFVTPKPFMPIVYALFNFTMSLSVTCKLGSVSSRKQNIFRSVISSLILAATLIAVTNVSDFSLPLPTLSDINGAFLKCLAIAAVSLSCVGGLVACGLPTVEQVDGAVGDKTLSAALVFCFAAAFSLFGFDFLIKFGYVFVAAIGIAAVTAAFVRIIAEKFFQKRLTSKK